MAKEWAKRFYNSKAWQECRAAYMRSRHGLCERCRKPGRIVHHSKVYLTPANIGDTHITMGWWNLELVCDECHNDEHHGTVTATRSGFAFDEEGNLIEAL